MSRTSLKFVWAISYLIFTVMLVAISGLFDKWYWQATIMIASFALFSWVTRVFVRLAKEADEFDMDREEF
jgi:hypothetical protein